jgi:hypothetical protein
MNYILEKEAVKGAISNYARYCLRTLEGMLSSGATGFVPSTEEILAYKERPPILATIELVDGTVISEELPVTPDLNVGKVVGICSHFLELHDSRKQHFGIFAYDVPGMTSSFVFQGMWRARVTQAACSRPGYLSSGPMLTFFPFISVCHMLLPNRRRGVQRGQAGGGHAAPLPRPGAHAPPPWQQCRLTHTIPLQYVIPMKLDLEKREGGC